jgi:NADH:ubiquinone oxidoreductase subunit 2 (subunit N)
MFTDTSDCGVSTWLAMAFMSVAGALVLLLLLLAIAALGRYVLTGGRTNRPSAP